MQKRSLIILSRILILSILFISYPKCSIADVDRASSLFLLADYHSAIQECESLIAEGDNKDEVAQANLLLGLCQAKIGRFDEARNNFNVLIQGFPKSKFTQRAYLALADTYFLEEDFQGALELYSNILKLYPNSDLKNLIYLKLGQTNLKLGYWQEAQRYLTKIEDEFSDSFFSDLAAQLLSCEYFFTIQVGSFKDYVKAKSLVNELSSKGYNSYIIEVKVDKERFYRVRVDKLFTRKEAIELKDKLSHEGYPAVIYP